MKMRWLGIGTIGALFFVAGSTFAQEKSALPVPSASSKQAYDLNREQTLVGTVVSFTASSATPPLGPRLALQTPSGVVDVHLGDARTLVANQLTIHPGDTLRIIGEEVIFAGTTQFVARILQKGTQAILMRSPHGFPIAPSVHPDAQSAQKQGSVL